MKIQRYQEYENYDEMAYEFINSFDVIINENSTDSNWKKVWNKLYKDLKLHMNLIATFGTGIGAFIPIVDKMMRNMNISTEFTYDKIILLTICSLTIIYLEEKKFKNQKEEEKLTLDSKSMLEELKMMGIGNGIVKMVKKSFESVKNLFQVIGKHIGATIGGVIDMFSYTSFLLPVMNGIYFLIGKYDLTPETMTQNLIGLGVGLGTLIAKHGIIYIINKIKDKFKVDASDVIDDIETPTIQKFALYNKEDGVDDVESINEQ